MVMGVGVGIAVGEGDETILAVGIAEGDGLMCGRGEGVTAVLCEGEIYIYVPMLTRRRKQKPAMSSAVLWASNFFKREALEEGSCGAFGGVGNGWRTTCIVYSIVS